MATVVNKFLTSKFYVDNTNFPLLSNINISSLFFKETFHMISKGDQSIASWTNGGNSFTIHNIKAFEKVCKFIR